MRPKARTIVIHGIAWTTAFAWTVPFLGVLMTAIRPITEVVHGWWNFGQFSPSAANFVFALTNSSFPMSRGYLNSLIVAIPATIVPLLVGALAAYAFARFSSPIRDYLFLTVVVLMAIPQQMVAIPIFQIMIGLNLIDNLVGLTLVHSAWALPWIVLFMRNFFSALPPEIEEAARVDGASDFKIFFKIVLPIAVPALAAGAVLQFMWVWNDFFFALILIFSPENLLASQIPLVLGRQGPFLVDWGLLTASSILLMLVPLLVFVFLQKYYIRGMIGWTVRG